jgi:hypothetical protein
VRLFGRDVPGHAVLIAALGLVAVPLLLVADPATSSFFPPCPWRAATGWLCPGCGSTRALHALLHGHLTEALQLNPFTVVALPVVAAHLIQEFIGGGDRLTARLRPIYIRVLAVGITLFGVLRNI